MHNAAGSGHLVGGISKWLTEFCFGSFKEPVKLGSLDYMLFSTWRKGKWDLSKFWSIRKRMHWRACQFPQLLFSFSLMPFVMNVLQVEAGTERFSLPITSPRLVTLTFRGPDLHVDRYKIYQYVQKSKGNCTLKTFKNWLNFQRKSRHNLSKIFWWILTLQSPWYQSSISTLYPHSFFLQAFIFWVKCHIWISSPTPKIIYV